MGIEDSISKNLLFRKFIICLNI